MKKAENSAPALSLVTVLSRRMRLLEKVPAEAGTIARNGLAFSTNLPDFLGRRAPPRVTG